MAFQPVESKTPRPIKGPRKSLEMKELTQGDLGSVRGLNNAPRGGQVLGQARLLCFKNLQFIGNMPLVVLTKILPMCRTMFCPPLHIKNNFLLSNFDMLYIVIVNTNENCSNSAFYNIIVYRERNRVLCANILLLSTILLVSIISRFCVSVKM